MKKKASTHEIEVTMTLGATVLTKTMAVKIPANMKTTTKEWLLDEALQWCANQWRGTVKIGNKTYWL